MAPELTALPSSFSAGSTVIYRRSLADYPANSGWTLTLHLRGGSIADPQELDQIAAPDGAVHVVTLAASDTADLTPGLYRWVERVSKGGEVYDVPGGPGLVTVEIDLASAAPADVITFAERALAAVEAKIEGRIPLDQEEIQILSRAVRRTGIEDLLKLRDYLRAEVAGARREGAPRKPILATFTPMGFDR